MFQIKLSVFTVGHDAVTFGQFFPFLWEDTCCGCSFRCFSVSDPGFLMHFDFSPGEIDSNRQHPRLYILLGLWSQGCTSEYPLLFLPPIYHSHFVSTMWHWEAESSLDLDLDSSSNFIFSFTFFILCPNQKDQLLNQVESVSI